MDEGQEKYMARALQLAERGFGSVSPNPMVGCVIVKEGKVIGEGWHHQCGKEHAEVDAVNSLPNREMVNGAEVYVTLEPCSHYGRTPPCAAMLLELKPSKVIVCNEDPNPLVAGRGIRLLRDAGIAVETGVLSEQGKHLNRRFFTAMIKKRPYIILKWAETSDGYIARSNYDSKWISNEESRKLVHKWRGQEDAIMVGTNTAKYDNPRLNVRETYGHDPVRVIIDKTLSLPKSLNLFDQSQTTICYNEKSDLSEEYLQYMKVAFDGTELQVIMEDLAKRKVNSIIVEGGSKLINSLLDQHLYDEVRRFISTKSFGEGIKAPDLSKCDGLNLIDERNIEGDSLELFIASQSAL